MPAIRTLLIPMAALGVALVAAQGASLPDRAMAPGEAHLSTLGDARAVTHYTVEQGGAFRVVTTIAVGEDATPVRTIATLQPGQAASVSVPGPFGTPPHEITFRHGGDRLSVVAPRRRDFALR
jgi:hypothetical protein